MTRHNTTRRTLFAAALAIPSMATACTGAFTRELPTGTNATLLQNGDRWAAMMAQYDAGSDALEHAYDRQEIIQGSPPEGLLVRPTDGKHLGGAFSGPVGEPHPWDRMDIIRRGSTQSDPKFDTHPFVKRGREIVAAYDQWRAQIAAAHEASGAAALEAKNESLDRAIYQLEQEAMAIRATTPEGISVKARMAARYLEVGESEHESIAEAYARAVIRDLLPAGGAQ
jgi:hypothetical protein